MRELPYFFRGGPWDGNCLMLDVRLEPYTIALTSHCTGRRGIYVLRGVSFYWDGPSGVDFAPREFEYPLPNANAAH